jgi:hypothetical protein
MYLTEVSMGDAEKTPDPKTSKPVRVLGPDNRMYKMPPGTTKDQAVSFFKQHNILSPESAPYKPKASKAPAGGSPAPVVPKVATPAPPHEESPQAKQAAALQAWLQNQRPRWDTPEAILSDPNPLGRQARYFGGELIGVAKAGVGWGIGGSKLLYDVADALNPIKGYEHPLEPQLQVGRDVLDIGKGVYDIGKGVYDLIRHFPEANADPEKFGNTVAQAAAVVDGGMKFATEVAKVMPAVDGAQILRQTQRVGRTGMNAVLRKGATERAYVHRGGIDIAENEIGKAVEKAQAHVKEHAQNLVAKIGKEPIAADAEAASIRTKLAEVKKTPERNHPILNEVLADADRTQPGSWTWEKTKQFRTRIGGAMQTTSGPTYAVLTDAYKRLTTKLRATAVDRGLEDSWDTYNELEEDIHRSFPLIEKAAKVVETKGSGVEMARALQDEAATGEVLDSLAKYGLNKKKVMTYSKLAGKIIRENSEFNKSLFRYVYRMNPAIVVTIPAMMAGRAAGGWLGGIAAATLAGSTVSYLMHTVRALRLSPEVLEHVILNRAWRDPTAIPEGRFPAEPPAVQPQLPPGQGPTPGTPPAGGAAPSPPASPAPAAPQLPAPREAAPVPRPERRVAPGAGPEGVERRVSSESQLKFAKEQLAKATTESEKEILRRRIEELEKEPSLAGGGEKLGKDIRAARAEAPAGVSEGEALQHIMKDKAQYEKYVLEDQKGRDKMLVAAKNELAKVTKVAEGEHGREPGVKKGTTRETKMTRAAKAAERVAKVRKAKGPTALGGGGLEVSGGGIADEAMRLKESEAAQRRAMAPGVDPAQMSIPELEEFLRREDRTGYDNLQKMRKAQALPDVEYKPALEWYYRNISEGKINAEGEGETPMGEIPRGESGPF